MFIMVDVEDFEESGDISEGHSFDDSEGEDSPLDVLVVSGQVRHIDVSRCGLCIYGRFLLSIITAVVIQ